MDNKVYYFVQLEDRSTHAIAVGDVLRIKRRGNPSIGHLKSYLEHFYNHTYPRGNRKCEYNGQIIMETDIDKEKSFVDLIITSLSPIEILYEYRVFVYLNSIKDIVEITERVHKKILCPQDGWSSSTLLTSEELINGMVDISHKFAQYFSSTSIELLPKQAITIEI